jgi:rhodanese-related sulfurtransferase
MDRELSPQQLSELLTAGEAQVVDVREDDEWSAGRMASARHIVLSTLVEQASSIERERPVVFVCRSGARSAMATEAFVASGYDAHNLTGGLQAWVAAGLPLEPAGGHVA